MTAISFVSDIRSSSNVNAATFGQLIYINNLERFTRMNKISATRSTRLWAKTNEAEARQRLAAFWAGSSLGRPALAVTVRRQDVAPLEWPGPELDPVEREQSVEWACFQAEAELAQTLYLAEAMPGFFPFRGAGLTLVAELAGGQYELTSDSAWIRTIEDIYDRPLPRFDPQHPTQRFLEECIRAMARVIETRGFVAPPSYLDGLTTLSKFRGTEQLCLDLIERPEDVRAWSDALTSIYIESFEQFYRLVASLGYGETASWLQAPAPGRVEAVQCDFGMTLSPAMFERFALPDLARLTEYLDFSLYHLDGVAQMRFLDLLRTLPHLNGIQWNPEPPMNPPTRWIDAFREIRRRNFNLFVWTESVEEAVTITREIGPDGLLIVLPQFASVDEAEAAIERIVKVC